jgi:oxygen-independent coproporphyrinogen-3 oxidase
VSNHARPGQQSRHNLTYWRYQDYAGIGPGAHGRRHATATTRHKKPENWLSAIEARRRHSGGPPALHPRTGRRAMLMGLRLAEGVDLAALPRALVCRPPIWPPRPP